MKHDIPKVEAFEKRWILRLGGVKIATALGIFSRYSLLLYIVCELTPSWRFGCVPVLELLDIFGDG